MHEVLSTQGLGFAYDGSAAVSDIDLTLERGDIFGFVGANGAGKTTTIKLILGLLTPTAGTIRVFGHSPAEDRIRVLRRIGSLVETPALYGHLTAAENLKIQQRAYGTAPGRIAEVLETAGLSTAAGKIVNRFSLGMKQRLGLAMSLLHEPELLVLDEPANGLDPQGIQDLRDMLRRLSAQGVTTFLSSHILAELEHVATKVAIIERGRLRYSGSLAELKSMRGVRLKIVLDDPARAAQVLARAGRAASQEGASLVLEVSDREACAEIAALLVREGLKLWELRPEQANLEEVFLEITRTPELELAS